jgi:hypothetical protein
MPENESLEYENTTILSSLALPTFTPRESKFAVHPNTETGFRQGFFSVRKINWRELFAREGKVKSFLRAVMSIFQFIHFNDSK